MKFAIDAAALNAALSAVGAAIILNDGPASSVRIEAPEPPALGAGRIEFRGTNLMIEITRYAEAKIGHSGAICVAHSRLAAWAKTIAPDAKIELVTEGSDIVCRAGQSRLRLPTLPADNFQGLPAPKDPVVFELSAASFVADLAHAVLVIVPESDPLPQLRGVHMTKRGTHLALESTVRLAAYRKLIDLPSGAGDLPASSGIVISAQTIKAIIAVLPPEGSVTVSIGEFLIQIDAPDVSLVSKLVDGDFPNLGRLIDIERQPVVSFDAASALTAIRRVLAGRIGDDKSSRCQLTFSGGQMTVSVGRPGDLSGEAEDGCECSAQSDLSIALNGQLLATLIEALDVETVELHIGDPGAPFLMRSAPDNEALVIGMPMR